MLVSGTYKGMKLEHTDAMLRFETSSLSLPQVFWQNKEEILQLGPKEREMLEDFPTMEQFHLTRNEVALYLEICARNEIDIQRIPNSLMVRIPSYCSALVIFYTIIYDFIKYDWQRTSYSFIFLAIIIVAIPIVIKLIILKVKENALNDVLKSDSITAYLEAVSLSRNKLLRKYYHHINS